MTDLVETLGRDGRGGRGGTEFRINIEVSDLVETLGKREGRSQFLCGSGNIH